MAGETSENEGSSGTTYSGVNSERKNVAEQHVCDENGVGEELVDNEKGIIRKVGPSALLPLPSAADQRAQYEQGEGRAKEQ